MFKFDEAGMLGKETIDSMLKGYATASEGLQAIATEAAEYSKSSFQANVAHMEKLMGVKSFESAIELNTSFAKSVMEGYIAEMTKIGEMYSDLAKSAYAPVKDAAVKTTEVVKASTARRLPQPPLPPDTAGIDQFEPVVRKDGRLLRF
jgi:hypothetical protein